MRKQNKSKVEVKTERSQSIKKSANLTQEEAALFERIKAEGQTGKEWERVTEDDALDFTLAQDPFKLPDFAQKLQDQMEYAFRWIERKKERVDEIRSMSIPQKWWIVNASTMPGCVDDLDPILGAVCIYDQLLVFKPYWMYMKEKQMEEAIMEDKAKGGELASKHKQAIDETGSEFLAGKEVKISGKDDVQWHETDVDKVADSDTAVIGAATAFEEGDDGLGDLVAEE